MKATLNCVCGHEKCQGPGRYDGINIQPMVLVTIRSNGLFFERMIPLELVTWGLFTGDNQGKFSHEDGSKKVEMHLDTHNNRVYVDPCDPIQKSTGTIGVSVDAKAFQHKLSLIIFEIAKLCRSAKGKV